MRAHAEGCSKSPCSCGLREQLQREFMDLSEPLIKFLCEEWHPHAQIIITPTSAELVSGELAFQTTEFLVD